MYTDTDDIIVAINDMLDGATLPELHDIYDFIESRLA